MRIVVLEAAPPHAPEALRRVSGPGLCEAVPAGAAAPREQAG